MHKLYNKYVVKVNNGSGCLIQPLSDNKFTYVITAKHVLKKEENIHTISTLENEKLKIQEIYYHTKLDLALIKVDFITGVNLFVSNSINPNVSLFLYGFPKNKIQDQVQVKKLPGSLIETQDNHWVFLPVNTTEQDDVIGYSGCGVFQEIEENIYLSGIQFEMDSEEDRQHGRLKFYPMFRVYEIIKENNLEEIDPKYISDSDEFIGKSQKQKLKEFAHNSYLKKVLEGLTNGASISISSYHEEPPFILGNIIKGFNLKEDIDNYSKNRTYGESRYKLIKKYFFTYLDLCRYSILSILWDEINHNLIKNHKTQISNLLKLSIDYNTEDIDCLSNLCNLILKIYGNRIEKDFITQLLPSIGLLKKGILLYQYAISKEQEELYWESEKLLHSILKDSYFLNHYSIKSVHSIYYLRNRADAVVKYKVEELPLIREEKTTNSKGFIDENFKNIHSVYLCKEGNEDKIVINLSPFYFDKNSFNLNAVKINLFVLEKKSIRGNESNFSFKPVYDPNFNSDKDESELIRKIGEKEKDYEKLKDKTTLIYKQLARFVESLNKSDEN
ncbi:MAG: hypothetical protein AAF611_00010 [Bacteroidota bacterium]